MKTTLYYFTGTGNSLAVARFLANQLGDAELVPVAAVVSGPGVVDDSDIIGIIFPVYYLDVPRIIREFIQKLQVNGPSYVFGIATCGQQAGHALFTLASLLENKKIPLNAGFVLVMPENFIGPVSLMEDPRIVHDKITEAYERIPEIATVIRERKKTIPEGSNSCFTHFGGFLTSKFMTSVYKTPKKIHATSACNRCRTCERICPTHNITVTESGVIWHDECTQCYACIHWCPKEAVAIGNRTKGKPRYHHPDVTLADMIQQRPE